MVSVSVHRKYHRHGIVSHSCIRRVYRLWPERCDFRHPGKCQTNAGNPHRTMQSEFCSSKKRQGIITCPCRVCSAYVELLPFMQPIYLSAIGGIHQHCMGRCPDAAEEVVGETRRYGDIQPATAVRSGKRARHRCQTGWSHRNDNTRRG